MNRILSLIILILFVSDFARAQITVNDSEDIIKVVKSLEGPGVKITNIRYRFSPRAAHRPAGSFSDDFGAIGLDKGLLLTSGAAANAIGPNNVPDKTQANNDSIQDPDLIPFIEKYNTSTNRMEDLCFVEFDLVSAFPILTFDYIFASEEYIEYLNYHDVFVFLISGPGIAGKKNIALVPNTNIPVSVASINPDINSQYYKSNGSGTTPWKDIDLQYDGFTTKLQATSNVIPCQTYHIKLAIADIADDQLDAGVFIEEKSFTSSNINLKVSYKHPRFNTAVEGCNDAYVIFKRPSYSDKTEPIRYDFTIKGSAINDLDYPLIANSIVIPAGADSAFLTISPYADGIPDDNEFVRLILKSPCFHFMDFDSADVSIRESIPYSIPSEKLCTGQSTTLNKTSIPGYNILWDTSTSLSCLQCTSPVVSASSTTSSQFYPYTAIDTASGCKARDSVNVETLQIKADFSYQLDSCYTSLDYFFVDNSKNAEVYKWNFGDMTFSSDASVLHQFPFYNKNNPLQYTVGLEVSRNNPSCSDDTTVTIQIKNPLFIPNLITANDDGKNDVLIISGIHTECWELSVYNRWGGLVYKNKNYKNNFSGDDLESGIYFFSIKNSRGDREFKSWVHILND